MNNVSKYPIGVAGQKWGSAEKQMWLAKQNYKRSYAEQVVEQIQALKSALQVDTYATLTYPNKDYPLYAMKNKHWQQNKPTILITGGVHGYETSGVHGVIRFMQTQVSKYTSDFNFVAIACVSPWGYETINRWNPDAIDPNRSFYRDSPAKEAQYLMDYVKSLNIEFLAHIDLHETTDTDNSEFRPALAARDAIEQKNWNIPDGFYLVGDSTKPQASFQRAIIQCVEKVTHIAPADSNNQLIGVPLEQEGVINYQARKLGLCMGLTDASYVTTTEVYPDSPLVDDDNCIDAQVAVITGAIAYFQANLSD